ncbi:MAG: 16S rRNA (guanine(527)-N(7))-methyltransferase RsmG [Pseudomonadota bacterium]
MSSVLPELTLAQQRTLATFDVSRETQERLEIYHQLLVKWQRTINLIGPETLAHAWERHFIDSAQLQPLLEDRKSIIDLGSGAGFPGLILAIMSTSQVHLVESDRRKVAFLRTVARTTDTHNVHIHASRLEQLSLERMDAVTARALAPLPLLLTMAVRFQQPNTLMVFPKGSSLHRELTEAKKEWHINYDIVPSCSDPNGLILRIFEARRERQG